MLDFFEALSDIAFDCDVWTSCFLYESGRIYTLTNQEYEMSMSEYTQREIVCDHFETFLESAQHCSQEDIVAAIDVAIECFCSKSENWPQYAHLVQSIKAAMDAEKDKI